MNTNRLKDLYVGSDYVPDEKMLRKTASHKLSPNIANWQIEILKVLGEDYGWVTDNVRPATVDLENVDKENGTGYGAVIVFQNPMPERGQRRADPAPKEPMGASILLPFTVRSYHMSPLDIFVSGKKVLPLTKKRIEEELMTAQIFTGVDKSRKNDQGSLSQLAPPPEAAYSRYGATAEGGMTHQGGAISDQDSLILEQLLSTMGETERRSFTDTIRSNPASLAQFVRNRNVDVLDRIIKARPLTPDDQKNVARWAFPKNVLLFEKVSAGRWRVTMMNDHYMVKDVIEASERKLMEQLSGIADVNQKLWSTDGFILTVNHKSIDPVVWHEGAVIETQPVAVPGVYLVVMANKSVEEGFAFESILDYDGNRLPWKLWYDGDSFAIQEQIQGERLSKEWTHDEGFLKPGVWGTFLRKEENGEANAVMPFKVLAVYVDRKTYPGTTMVRATDMFGHDVNFLIERSGGGKWRNATGVLSAGISSQYGSRGYWVPGDTQFVTLGSQWMTAMSSVSEVAAGMRDTAMSSFAHVRDKTRPATSVAVTALMDGRYRLEGNCMDGLISQNGIDESELRTKWILVMLGCSLDDAQKICDRARAQHRVIVMNLRAPKNEANIRIDKQNEEVLKISKVIRKDLFKEAAYIRDKKSVDALLSLNFVSPDNLIIFLKNLPNFREVEGNLAKLLLMARFGLEAVPEQAIENALKNLNLVNESLEMLSGVVGNQMSAHGDIEFEEQEVPPGASSTLE